MPKHTHHSLGGLKDIYNFYYCRLLRTREPGRSLKDTYNFYYCRLPIQQTQKREV